MTTPLPSGDIERLVEHARKNARWLKRTYRDTAIHSIADRLLDLATALSDLTRRCEALERERDGRD